MTNSNSDAITNTNTNRVCIMKNSDGTFVIFNAAARDQAPATATGLGDAMAAAYRLIG